MAGNSGAWGVALLDPRTQEWVSISGGDAVDEFLPSTPIACLTAPPDGMGVPPLRDEDVTFAQRDGKSFYSDWYENRVITLIGTVCNDGCPGCPTGRAKARQLLRAWSRMCGETTLMIITDCHDPEMTDTAVTGPYHVTGRPRQGLINWHTSDIGCAEVVLRFDAVDHRLFIPDETGEFTQCSEQIPAQDTRTNLMHDPSLLGVPWTSGGADVTDTRQATGGPHDRGWWMRTWDTQPTTPAEMSLSLTGIFGSPVAANTEYTLSAYWRNGPGVGGEQFYSARFYDANGDLIGGSEISSPDLGLLDDELWRREDWTFTTPANTSFVNLLAVWGGTMTEYPVDSEVAIAQTILVEGNVPLPYFDGQWLGTAQSGGNTLIYTSPFTRRNWVANPRTAGSSSLTWSFNATGNDPIAISATGGPDTSDPLIAFAGTSASGYYSLAWPVAGDLSFFGPFWIGTPQSMSPFPAGTPYLVSMWVRVNQAPPAGLEFAVTEATSDNVHAVVSPTPLVITPNVWTRFEITGVTAFDQTATLNPRINGAAVAIPAGFQIDLALAFAEFEPVAPSLYFDGSSNGAAWSATAERSISGISFVESEMVTITGDLCASLVIELHGPLTAPIVLQETTPENPQYGVQTNNFVQYKADIPDGEVIIINTGTREATDSSGDVTGNVTGNLSWNLEPGDHDISMTTGGGTGFAVICWTASVVSG